MITLQDLEDMLLFRCDPEEIVELLDISSQELIDNFGGKIEDRFEYIAKELDVEEFE